MAKEIKETIVIYDSFNPPPIVPSSPGRDLVPNYREVLEDGRCGRLEHIGDSSMQDQIQSFSASVDIKDRIARYLSGDANALFTNGGFYADLSNAPTSLSEAVKININLMDSYERLPQEVKDVFGTFDDFKASCFDRTFDKKVAQFLAKTKVVDEVKKDESTE